MQTCTQAHQSLQLLSEEGEEDKVRFAELLIFGGALLQIIFSSDLPNHLKPFQETCYPNRKHRVTANLS